MSSEAQPPVPTQAVQRIPPELEAKMHDTLSNRTLAARREGLSRLILKAPDLLAALTGAGLPAATTAEEVESILISDPFLADGELSTTDRVCPDTKRPRRRFLVVVAEGLLKLIAEARSHASLTQQQPGAAAAADQPDVGVVIRRGIPINPHLLLIAYHAALRRDDTDIEPVHRELAGQLVHTLTLLQQALLDVPADGRPKPPQRQHIGRLVMSFARTWREYIRVAVTVARAAAGPGGADAPPTPLSPSSPKSRAGFSGEAATNADAAQRELVKAAIETYVSLSELRAKLGEGGAPVTEEAAAELDHQMQAVRRRVERIGGDDAVRALEARLPAAGGTSTGGVAQPRRSRRAADVTISGAETTSADEKDKPCVVPTGGLTPHADPHAAARAGRGLQTSAFAPSASESEAEGGKLDAKEGSSTKTTGVPTENTSLPPYKPNRTTPMGPGLPPDWSVGTDGRSHPPKGPTQEEVARERRKALEFKVNAAYKARLNLQQVSAQSAAQGGEKNAAVRNITAQVHDSMWTALRQELHATPPVLTRLPSLLQVVADGLGEAVPKRLRARVEREIRDALDWSSLQRTSRPSLTDFRSSVVSALRYIGARIDEYGSAAQSAKVGKEADALEKRVNAAADAGDTSAMADVVVEIFQTLFAAVKELHEEIAKYGMAFISSELARQVVPAAQQYAKDWLPAPSEWSTSRAWALASMQAAVAARHIANRGKGPWSQADVESTVAHGVLSLCASANKSLPTRWVDYPVEALAFEKEAIFASANTVQFCTLRMMILTTVGMLVSQPAGKPLLPKEKVAALQDGLDAHLRVWLGMAPNAPGSNDDQQQMLSLAKLKEEVVTDVNHALVEHNAAALLESNSSTSYVLSETSTRVLHNMLEKLSQTDSREYAMFEKRIVDALALAVHTQLEASRNAQQAAAAPSDSDDSDGDDRKQMAVEQALGKLGAVASDIRDVANDLVKVVQLNVAVHHETYSKVLLVN